MKLNLISKTCLATLVLSGPLLAQSPNERDFQLVRANREKAVAAALEPINRRYKEDLEKLFRRATQESELELARAIQAELAAYGGAAPAPVDTAPTSVGGPAVSKTELRKLIADSQWAPSNGGVINFYRNGEISHTGVTPPLWGHFWEVEAPDILKIYGKDPEKDRDEPFRLLHVDVIAKTAVQDPAASTRGGTLVIKYTGPSKRPD